MKPNAGATLTELLAAICIIVLLVALALVPITKAYLHAKAWIYASYSWHELRLKTLADDEASDKTAAFYLENAPKKWDWVERYHGGTRVLVNQGKH